MNCSKISLVNDCFRSDQLVFYEFNDLGIAKRAWPIVLTPAFSDNNKLFDGSGYHCVTIASFGSKNFLIDCSYSQFLLQIKTY